MCDVESIFRALESRQRRVAIRTLQHHRTVSLADLAELVAEDEAGEGVPSLPPERVRDVYFSLYHTHLPVLVAADLAWYEQEDDLVGVSERANERLRTARETVDSLRDPEAER